MGAIEKIQSNQEKLVSAQLHDRIKIPMDSNGVLESFLPVYDTIEAGLQALRE